MALTVKEAIQAARTHFVELFPDADADFRLEEIERHGEDWAITFSVSGSMSGSKFAGSPFGMGRVGKVIVVDGETGEFVSLKQRAA